MRGWAGFPCLVFCMFSVSASFGQTLTPLSAPSVTRFGIGDSTWTVSHDPGDDVRRIVLFMSPPLSVVKQADPGKAASLARAAAAVDTEHARFRADVQLLDAALSKQGSRSVIDREYRHALNGVAVTTTRDAARRMADLPYVLGVYDNPRRTASRISDSGPFHYVARRNEAAGGDGVVVAIVDTGVDYDHPALGGGFGPGFKVAGGYDFVDDDSDPMDENGHGTHVAGIVAGDDGSGFAGVAPSATLLAYRVLNSDGYGDSSDIIAAIERALDPDGNPETDDAVDIINMSLGGSGHPDDPESQAVDNATAAGILSVVAAGNNGGFFSVDSPGVARSALTVGAVDDEDRIASFSSRGPVASTFENKPDVVGPGVDILSTLPGGEFGELSGTSMATPFVAGQAALLIERYPEWDPATTKAAMMSGARDLGLGLWEQGAGRVDVAASEALNAVLIPSEIDFGNLDPDLPGTVMTRILTVRNLTGTAMTGMLGVNHQIPGAQIVVQPATISLAPGAESTVELLATFSPAEIPVPPALETPYAGYLTLTGSGPEARVPFTVTKTPQLIVHFDTIPHSVSVLNEAGGLDTGYQFAEVMSFPLPPGTYEILSSFDMPEGDVFVTGVHLSQPVVLAGKSEVFVSSADISNRVQFSALGAGGQPVPADYVTLGVRHTSGFSFSRQTMAPVVYMSDDVGRLEVETLIHSYSDPSGVDYVIPMAHRSGASGAVTVENDPNEFREMRTRFDVGPGTTKLFVAPVKYTRIGPSILVTDSWFDGARSNLHEITAPFERVVRYGAWPHDRFGFPVVAEEIYDTSDGSRADLTGRENLYLISPAIRAESDRLDLFTHMNINTPLRSIYEQSTDETWGSGPLVMRARMANSPSMIRLQQATERAIFFGQSDEIVGGRVTWKVLRSGTGMLGGTFMNDMNVRSPIMLDAAPVDLQLSFDGFHLEERSVTASARFRFDTRQTTSGYDPDPPVITSVRVTANGERTQVLDPDGDNRIEVQVADAGIPPASSITAAGIDVRRADESDWLPLTTTFNKGLMTAEWPSDPSPGYYDLRISVRDAAGNSVEYAVAPALRYGSNAGNRPPSSPTLIHPLELTEVDTDTLVSPVRFSWTASEDPDGQDVRYVFRLHGPGLDTTLTTSGLTLDVPLGGRLDYASAYVWSVSASDGFVATPSAQEFSVLTLPFGVSSEYADVPDSISLDSVFPNPFRSSASIRFQLPGTSTVRVTVVDMLGRSRTVLDDRLYPAGAHEYAWDASALPSGSYVLVMDAGPKRFTRMVVLLR